MFYENIDFASLLLEVWVQVLAAADNDTRG